MAKENVYLASKPRYEILDGLRGVAALMVVAFHLFESYSKGPAYQIINHGYLAVDFFFLLSGFVIGYAYDDRWDKMTLGGFFKRRLVRLHPMVIAGTVIGASMYFFASGPAFPMIGEVEAWKWGLCLLLGLFMIPAPTSLDIRGWGETNSFNGPTWSLTFEYIGNILYALVFRHLSKVVLAILCLICAVFTLDLTLGWDIFGLFPNGPKFNVIGGWSLTSKQLYIGFARLLYPFLCGILISRILSTRRTKSNSSGSPFNIKGGFWLTAIMIVLILSIPCIGGRQCIWDGIYQAVAILFIFPVIVLIGAGSKTTDSRSTAICKWLGDISYPLYITHFPFMYIQMNWAIANPDAPMWQHISASVGAFVFSVILAWGMLKSYDEPVRKWLTDKVLRCKR